MLISLQAVVTHLDVTVDSLSHVAMFKCFHCNVTIEVLFVFIDKMYPICLATLQKQR